MLKPELEDTPDSSICFGKKQNVKPSSVNRPSGQAICDVKYAPLPAVDSGRRYCQFPDPFSQF